MVYNKTDSVSSSLWLAVYVMAGGFFVAIIVNHIEKRNEELRKQKKFIRVATNLV